ncbi:MAG: tetraacyldisaccharide 4'-kinase [Planctomycetales bacterium]|nr:tetraacyldisaccharide 4'-kinase [Planctomycetales bacterium]
MTDGASTTDCDYCGLPVPRAWFGSRAVDEESLQPRYCCYGCQFASRVTQESGEEGAARWTLTRLGLAIFLTMNVMVFTMTLWSFDVYGVDQSTGTSASLAGLLRSLCLLLSAPVLLLLGQPIIISALQALKRGVLSTDILVMAGVIAAFVYSVVSVIRGAGQTYFEVGCMVLVMMTLGRWLEATSRIRATETLDELEQLLPDVPHLQNPDRVAAAQVAVDELDMQVLLLDDAFQHRRIHRDLDIVLLDATAPFGYDHVFPRGMLRESLRALARADVIALSRADLVSPSERQTIRETARHYAPSAQWIEIIHQPQDWIDAQGSRHPLESLRNQRVAAFCGIGNPHAFRQALSHCGCDVVELREFPDHHPYHRDDIQTLSKWIDSISPVDSVVCTHKDLVKIGLMRIDRLPLLALRIGIQFQAGKESFEKLLAAFAP